jgi:hypothetical protein
MPPAPVSTSHQVRSDPQQRRRTDIHLLVGLSRVLDVDGGIHALQLKVAGGDLASEKGENSSNVSKGNDGEND